MFHKSLEKACYFYEHKTSVSSAEMRIIKFR